LSCEGRQTIEISRLVTFATRRLLGTLGRVVSCAAGEEDEQGRVEARIMRLGERFPAASKAATARRYDLPQASPRTVKLGLDGRPTRFPRL
jgi:hypothetical protein